MRVLSGKYLVALAVLVLAFVLVAKPHLHYYEPEDALIQNCAGGHIVDLNAPNKPCRDGEQIAPARPGYYALLWGDRRY